MLGQNPLDDIHNSNTIRYVMKNGRLYEGDTLDEEDARSGPGPPLPLSAWSRQGSSACS